MSKATPVSKKLILEYLMDDVSDGDMILESIEKHKKEIQAQIDIAVKDCIKSKDFGKVVKTQLMEYLYDDPMEIFDRAGMFKKLADHIKAHVTIK
jgi:hypothetical protein